MNRVVPWAVPDGNPDGQFDVLEARYAGPGAGNHAEAAAICMGMGAHDDRGQRENRDIRPIEFREITR